MTRLFSGHSYDVAVVGSGPAGSSTALCLAKQGMTVALLEKASLPRYKTCGGGLVRRALRLLPCDIRRAVAQDCYTAELHLVDANLHFSTKRQEPIISMTMRENFDFLIASVAKEAGAELRPKCEVLDVVILPDRVKLVTSEGVLLARFVVAADGALSVVARKAGWQETRYLIPALEYEVAVNDKVLSRFIHAARFDVGVVPYGYAWVFPKKDHLSIGMLSTRRGPINLNGMLKRYLKTIGIDQTRGLERHGFLIPVSPRKGTFVQRRVLLTGDVAGFADPLTGEGITFAVQSGQIAARALLDGAFNEGHIRQVYDSEVAHRILPELRLGRVLAKLIYAYPSVRTRLFRLYGQQFSEAVTDVLMGERTLRGILRNPSNYLKLLRFWGRKQISA